MPYSVRVYGAGGCGTNIASRYFKESNSSVSLEPAILDTSEANLADVDRSKISTYLVEGTDGSGKIRQDNYPKIKESIKQMLVEIPAKDLNIVVFSAGGGSGSVIGPLILSELLSRKEMAIAIVIGDAESLVSAENTKKTLQSLELVSQKTEIPVVMNYIMNDVNQSRSSINKLAYMTISSISTLVRSGVTEIDRQDIFNWLHFHKITGESQLSSLEILLDGSNIDNSRIPCSVASLYQDPDQEHRSFSTDYHTVGYDPNLGDININKELHFVISTHSLTNIYSQIEQIASKIRERKDAQPPRKSIVSDDNGDDLIL